MDYLFNISAEMKRRGKKHRVNPDRFFHIMNEGWFVYLRQEKEQLKCCQQNNGVAGPFETRPLANTYLQRVVSLGPSFNESELENPSDNSGEDWRY